MKLFLLLSICLIPLGDLRAEFGGVAKEGDMAFPFKGRSADGSDFYLDTLKGKVILIYFFSPENGAGMMELKMLMNEVWPKFKRSGLAMVGVCRGGGLPQVAKLAKELKADFPLIPDPEKDIFHHYAAEGHPRAYVIGKDRTIKLVSLGYTDDEIDRIAWWVDKELKL